MWVGFYHSPKVQTGALGQEEISHLADGIAGDAGKGETDRLAGAGESGDIVSHAMMKRLGGRAVEGESVIVLGAHLVSPRQSCHTLRIGHAGKMSREFE